jgi:hypothetical protein
VIKLIEMREITPYKWVHPDGDDRRWNPAHSFPANVSGGLSEFDGRDGPIPFVSSDRDAQAMYFVEPNALNRLAVGKDHGLADKLSLGSLELAEDRACALLHGWHDGVPQIGRIVRRWLVFERRGSRDERAADMSVAGPRSKL